MGSYHAAEAQKDDLFGTVTSITKNNKSLCNSVNGLPANSSRVLPMDLYLEKRIHFYRLWRDLSTVIGENNVTAEDYQDPDGRKDGQTQRRADTPISSSWMSRNNSGKNGFG